MYPFPWDDGRGYLELPPNIFTNLTEATVEGWIKLERFGSYDLFLTQAKRNRRSSFLKDHILAICSSMFGLGRDGIT